MTRFLSYKRPLAFKKGEVVVSTTVQKPTQSQANEETEKYSANERTR